MSISRTWPHLRVELQEVPVRDPQLLHQLLLIYLHNADMQPWNRVLPLTFSQLSERYALASSCKIGPDLDELGMPFRVDTDPLVPAREPLPQGRRVARVDRPHDIVARPRDGQAALVHVGEPARDGANATSWQPSSEYIAKAQEPAQRF